MKILDNGIAIVETDTHIGKWIQESGRIDHDMTVELHILPMFKPEWWVVDVGADVGSHTVRYAERAARVIAFEPNRDEFNCLVWNCRNLSNVTCFPAALSAEPMVAELLKCDNVGAGHINPNLSPTWEVICVPLDSFHFPRLDFIKMDVEGFEPWVIRGGRRVIQHHRPTLLIEMNAGALARYGQTYRKIFEGLASFGYQWRSFPRDCDLMHTPQYDLLATPK